MSKDATGITYDEWQAAIAEAMAPKKGDSAGLTLQEIMGMASKSKETVLSMLRKFHRDGRLVASTKSAVTITGRPYRVPVYSIAAKK